MRSRGLISLGIVASCFLAACEYWNNFVDEKSITQVTLSIKVQDAWTGEAISQAVCEDTARNIMLRTGDDGLAFLENASTGDYQFLCQGLSYHDAIKTFSLGKTPLPITATLVRLGGPDWYPEHPDRQFHFNRAEGNLRVPGNQVFRTTLNDTSGKILYKWKSSKHPQLGRDWSSPFFYRNYFTANLTTLASDSVEDTITLFLRARFPGHPDYDIDSLKTPVTWVRNIPPELSIFFTTRGFAQVGCPDLDKMEWNLRYIAKDVDGESCNVTFSSDDSTSSVGKFKFTQSCDDQFITIPLINSFASIKNTEILKVITHSNVINISAQDDNGQSHDTTMTLITRPHIPPQISITRLSSPSIVYEGKSLAFKFTAQAFSAALVNLEVFWGDGITRPYEFSDGNSIDSIGKELSHAYQKAGKYYVSAKITDGCKDTTRIELPTPINIFSNSIPVLTASTPFTNFVGSKKYHFINITASDADLESLTDSLELRIDWGDGFVDTIPRKGSSLIFTPNHFYSNPPFDTINNVYHMQITLTDANGGAASKNFEIKPILP
jgi:hypothetical protein